MDGITRHRVIAGIIVSDDCISVCTLRSNIIMGIAGQRLRHFGKQYTVIIEPITSHILIIRGGLPI
ncbi:hypothetical protein D3C73_744140 [compost metagenome]